jgi:hypothetical protein
VKYLSVVAKPDWKTQQAIEAKGAAESLAKATDGVVVPDMVDADLF